MSDLRYDIFETRFGWVGVLASDKGLRRSTLPQESPEECAQELGKDMEIADHSPDSFVELRGKLVRYFDGECVKFEAELVDWPDATPFFVSLWEACRTIPPGETRTYRWLAVQAGRPQAPRVAGQSMAKNRLPVIVPCHRVVASDGSLRGFGKGANQLDLKQRMLDLERRPD